MPTPAFLPRLYDGYYHFQHQCHPNNKFAAQIKLGNEYERVF